ncbi:two pore domain potassium channel family protein [Micromonospora sp. HM134]|uniref:potassium channel family protein n=1 Tax=unclassified Micromonospora TaxID=2617518 RepID=UPI001198B592|nr:MULTISPECIES: potassium channel family protein [unclassified Micromonospora]QDY07312.1 two pore domain potassium channel family protein [Micromonospora sp. HM134]
MASDDGSYARIRRHTLAACCLLVVSFFLIPLEPDPNGVRLTLRAVGTLVLIGVVTVLVTRQVSRQLGAGTPVGDDEVKSLSRLVVALVAGLLAFAVADYVVAASGPEQFSGLRTRLDALYFALATLTTIGYGDVHPEGQLAKAVVCVQMLFSIGVIATGASIVVKRLTARPGRGRR